MKKNNKLKKVASPDMEGVRGSIPLVPTRHTDDFAVA